MADSELPEDDWHTHVFVFLDICCDKCEFEPDLRWAWDDIQKESDAAVVFTIRAVRHLKDADWIMNGSRPICPTCAEMLRLMPDVAQDQSTT